MGAIIGILNDILNKQSTRPNPKALLLVANSELAWMIHKTLMQLLPWTGLLPHPMIEGSELPVSKHASWLYPLIIATPNAILDAIKCETIDLKLVDYFLFDRADKLFNDTTTIEQYRRFCSALGVRHGVRVLTSHHELSQSIADICLRKRSQVRVQSCVPPKQIPLLFVARPPDEPARQTVVRCIKSLLPREQLLILTHSLRMSIVLFNHLRSNLPEAFPVGVAHSGKSKEEQSNTIYSFTAGCLQVLAAEKCPDLKVCKVSTVILLSPPWKLDVILKGADQIKPTNGRIVIIYNPKCARERDLCKRLEEQWTQTRNMPVIWSEDLVFPDSPTFSLGRIFDRKAPPSSTLIVSGLPPEKSNWEVLSAMSKHSPLDIDRKMSSVGRWEQ